MKNPDCNNARSMIMEAAGEIFSEEGFERATIRKICSRAGVNIASVNYHFGDKEGLYLAVLNHYRERVYEEYPPDLGIDETSSAEDRLRAFIRSFMYRILGPGIPSRFGKLLAREFIEPTKALSVVVEESIRPSYNFLMATVSMLIDADNDKRILGLCTASIVGQCLYYRNSRELISRIIEKKSFSNSEIEDIAEHITRFSLEAIRTCYGTGKRIRIETLTDKGPGVSNGKRRTG